MSSTESNVWVNRFDLLYSDEEIERRIKVEAIPILSLSEYPVELAGHLIKGAMKNVFVPTEQVKTILRKLVGEAHAHSVKYYSDLERFISGCYQKEAPLLNLYPAICLTGYAGNGKSELLKALARLLSDKHTAVADPNHAPFSLTAHWGVSIQSRTSANELLSAFFPSDCQAAGAEKKTAITKRLRKLAFRDGVSLLTADEFQFVTLSSSANTLATSMLLSICFIGLPSVYAANFSLVGRLLKRNHEDKQRLLNSPIVLLPDFPESEDWVKTLNSLKAVAPDVFTFDAEKYRYQIYDYTAGIKRVLVELLVLSYAIARKQNKTVNIEHIQDAYRSSEFSAHRCDVEIIIRQNVTGKKERDDLWCPIEIPEEAKLRFTKLAAQARKRALAEEALRSSMNESERKALEQIEKSNKKLLPKVSANKSKPRSKLTAAGLLANAALMNP
jgi:energy-coupling factor transporter ATP-binding protein EcfA2